MDEVFLPNLGEMYSALSSADGSISPAQLLSPQHSTKLVQQMALARSQAVQSAGLEYFAFPPPLAQAFGIIDLFTISAVQWSLREARD